jgi:hypothetical protein
MSQSFKSLLAQQTAANCMDLGSAKVDTSYYDRSKMMGIVQCLWCVAMGIYMDGHLMRQLLLQKRVLLFAGNTQQIEYI